MQLSFNFMRGVNGTHSTIMSALNIHLTQSPRHDWELQSA